jgi:dihydroorotate dehydrogenase (NAD+) catalytic subunit
MKTTASLPIEFCGIELSSPVINGSGTYDAIASRRIFGDEAFASENFPFAAFVSKTITENPRAGNPPNRIWETPTGMINSIGLPNPGLDGFVEDHLPILAELPVPLIVSVMAETPEGFTRLVERIEETGRASALELNVSCPNVHSGLIVGEQPTETEQLMKHLKGRTELPLIVKLTPNVASPEEVAVAAEAGGADAVSLINTIKATAIDPVSGSPAIGAGSGGLSGPAVRPVALQQVRAIRSRVSIPIIGMGGVTDGESALEFLLAGASLVAVGTENFRDPVAGRRIERELGAELTRRGFDSIGAFCDRPSS